LENQLTKWFPPENQLTKSSPAKAKKRRPKPRKKRLPKAAPSLPPPVETSAAPESVYSASQPAERGLLDGIGDLLRSKMPNPGTVAGSVPSSSPSSTSEPLSAESERLLDSVRGPIGSAEGGDPGEPGADEAISGLMAMVAFEPQDVQDTVCEFFEWLAGRFDSDHWKLTDRQARMMGKPTAQLLNSLWAKLQTVLPDILTRWCEETPGATAFILACGIVVVPKIGKQIAISRERSKAKPRVPTVQAITEQPPPSPKGVPRFTERPV